RNLPFLIFLYKYSREEPKFSIVPLYQLNFYKKFRKVKNFHIQFGTNKYPIDILKKINFIKSNLITSFHGHDLYFPINGQIKNENYYQHLFLYGDYFIANTYYLKNILFELGAPAEKIKTIPVGVDTHFFKPLKNESIDGNCIRLITVGRLEIFKGQKWGVEAIK